MAIRCMALRYWNGLIYLSAIEIEKIEMKSQHDLNNQKQRMLNKAYEKYGTDITPTTKAGTWEKSFVEYGNKIMLWFNTPDHSTHTIREDIGENN